MAPSVLTEAWRSAARDLGIEIVVPYTLSMASGASVEAALLVKDFGAPKGTLLSTSEDAFLLLGNEIVEQGYAYSAFCGDELSYNRDKFIDILTEWGWTGAENRRPGWSR